MHDIDRTQQELELAMKEFQPTNYEYQGEWSQGESGYANEAWQELSQEEEREQGEDEAEEYEMAAELLEVTNEEELDQFISKKLRGIKRHAGRGIGKFTRSIPAPLRQALGNALKQVASGGLQAAGKYISAHIPGQYGNVISNRLTSAAGNLLGLELEGLSQEDREFEVARRFARIAIEATKNAAQAPPNANPQAAAKAAVMMAVRKHAPGLARRRCKCPVHGEAASNEYAGEYSSEYAGEYANEFEYETAGPAPADAAAQSLPAGSRNRGTWIRRGRRIILMGL